MEGQRSLYDFGHHYTHPGCKTRRDMYYLSPITNKDFFFLSEYTEKNPGKNGSPVYKILIQFQLQTLLRIP